MSTSSSIETKRLGGLHYKVISAPRRYVTTVACLKRASCPAARDDKACGTSALKPAGNWAGSAKPKKIGGLAGLPFAKFDTADRDGARRAVSRARIGTHVRVAPRRGRAGKSASCRPSPALAKFQVTAEMDWDGE